MDLPTDALVNYILPNNSEVWWSLMIVIYPFITGLVAGAFVVSSLYNLLKIKEFKPIANFALVSAFCFGLFAGMPLLVHLGQPQRALEIYITPHTTSAMSVFGYVYTGYMVLLVLELWLIYRPVFIQRFNETTGLQRFLWYVLTLGVTTCHPGSTKLDHKLAIILAGIGVPWACLLHGYVGFVFGSVKAISWWATALQPIIFLSSAVVSGIAILILMYVFIKWWNQAPYDYTMIKKLGAILWAAFIIDWGLEMLEVAHVWYQNAHEWDVIEPLLLGPLYLPYIWCQIGLLSVVPTILLGYAVLAGNTGKRMLYLVSFSSLLLVSQVLVMRFNVVVGGQLISKSRRGFVDFEWEIFSKEGILTALLILSAPFITYYVISRFLPIFDEPTRQAGDGSA
jgi:Ni/Fe-hydrogenase subunit HybB-like protein